MYRITDFRYSEAISYVFELLPYPIFRFLEYTHFLTGTDPVYAGLHNYIDIGDGRSYRYTEHVSYPEHDVTKHEVTTIVLPTLKAAYLYVITHELGHCLDEILGFEYLASPINEYARTHRREAFAEAFACQYFWLGEEAEDIFQSDKAIQYLFEQLKGGLRCHIQ